MVDTITNEISSEPAVEAANTNEAKTLFDIEDNENQNEAETTKPKETTNAPSEDSATASGWYYDDKIKGNGELPEWFKHKTFKNVTEQAKAYEGLQKKLTEYSEKFKSFTGAPEQYEENDNTKDNMFAMGLKELGKKIGLNQEGFNELLNTYNQTKEIESEKKQTDLLQKQKAELNKIGGVGKLKELQTRFIEHFGDKNIGDWLKSSIKSYDDYVNLERIVSSVSTKTRVPVNIGSHVSTREQVEELIRDPRWGKDREFTQRVDKLMGQMLHGRHS